MILKTCLAVLACIAVSEAATAITPQNTNFTAVANRVGVIRFNVTSFQTTDSVTWSYQTTASSAQEQIVSGTRSNLQLNQGNAKIARYDVNASATDVTLIIKNVATSDAGRYTVQVGGLAAVNTYLHVAEITTLILKHGSRSGPNDFEIPLDDDVTVECTATNVQPKPEFRWYLGEYPLDTRQRLTSGITTPNTQPSNNRYTVTSTLRTKFAKSQRNKKLTCALKLGTLDNAVHTYATLGAGDNVASKLVLAVLAFVAHSWLH